jgi:hypothetical protein
MSLLKKIKDSKTFADSICKALEKPMSDSFYRAQVELYKRQAAESKRINNILTMSVEKLHRQFTI